MPNIPHLVKLHVSSVESKAHALAKERKRVRRRRQCRIPWPGCRRDRFGIISKEHTVSLSRPLAQDSPVDGCLERTSTGRDDSR